MNERIYELATRAGAYCETYLYGGDPKPPELSTMDLEKFALLLIRQCADIADRAEPYKANDLILKHFGVIE